MERTSNYKKTVITRVTGEYRRFKEKMLKKSKEEIFDSAMEIFVYFEFQAFLVESFVKNDDTFDVAYKCLYHEKGGILFQLWQFYLKTELATVESGASTKDTILQYCKKYHRDLFEQGDKNE